MDRLRIFSMLDEFQCGPRLERFEKTWLYVERAVRSRSSEAATEAGMRQRVSAHDDMRRRRERGNFGDQFLDDGTAERVEVLGHQNERARAADNVVLIVLLETARGVGVFGIPRHRPVAQDDESIDDDPLATVSSRASFTSRPALLVPSPETSMVRRAPLNGARSN